MSVRLGISVLDLLPQTTGIALQVPDDIVERIGVLAILNYRSTTSNDFFLHEGTLQAAADALDLDTSDWAVRIPGLTHGLPFRLAVQRVVAATVAQEEGIPVNWTLDIQVWDVEVLIPGVRAAKPVGGSGTTPLTLQPTGNTDAARRVFLVSSGVVRVSGGGPAGTQVLLVDAPDPLDPTAPTGTVIRLTAKPPHFLFGDSQYGMTLDRLVLDLSQTFTPADIEARGHDETWEGLAFKETTFYFPPDTPIVHSLSVSARDVIIGSPGGLQGELRIEFGEDFKDVYNTRLSIKRQSGTTEVDVPETTPPPRGTTLQYAIASPGTQRIRAVFQIGDNELIAGHTDLAARGVWWQLPDGSEGNSASTPWFEAPTTGLLRYRLRLGPPLVAFTQPSQPSAVPDGQTELVEVTVRFPRQAGSPTGEAPLVDATVGATTFRNVLHLRGPRERLAGVVMNRRGGITATSWRLGAGSAPVTQTSGTTFTLPLLAQGTSTADLLVADANGIRRVHIEIVAQGPLVVGHQQNETNTSLGVVTIVGAGDAEPIAVADTFLATPFHTDNERRTAPSLATIASATVTVPQGSVAEVEVLVPTGDGDPLPVPVAVNTQVSRVVQVLYEWDQANPVRVLYPYSGSDATDADKHEPDARALALHLDGSRNRPDGTDVLAQLRNWINALGMPSGTRKYYVVGRTDDLKYGATKEENDTYNDRLATDRAAAAAAALVSAGVALSDIVTRCERQPFSSDPPDLLPARIAYVGRLALPAGAIETPVGANSPVWNERWNTDASTWAAHVIARDDPVRPPYRCAEIYADDTAAPPPPPPPSPQPGVPTRVMVPGPDGPPPPTAISTTTGAPPTDYRVRLRVKWDSPTVVTAGDAIPTLAEALVAWKAAQVELPATASGTAPPIPPPTGPDYWQILLNWAYDARSGQTEASGALSLPDGALNIPSDALAGALAFGPAITALANPADTVTDPLGQFVAAAAILAVGAAIGELINTGGGPSSSVDIDKITISYKWNGAAHGAATLDYTVDLRVNVSIAGAGSLVGRLKLRYKGVGLRFDGRPEGGLAGVALTYDSMSVEVADPGNWSLGGPLGNLIRIAASRIGNGSQWMEFDLEFALDLGVVRLEGATIRLGLSPFSVEFRGLTASVDIPATLKGRGSVSIGDGGSFRALLAIEVIPAKLSAYGALAVDQDFVAVEVGVQLPVGIPLGGTGFGIFGFVGRFVANGTRNTEGLTNADPVQKQLDWYVRPPQLKYSRLSGQYAFGVGAVIGTLPDGGFTFNAEGSLTIGFPDVSVIFGIQAQLIAQRKSQASESGTPSAATFRILGMVLIEPDSIMVAVRASYEIPKVLKLEIPLSAYFPLAGGDAWFIRIGTDNDNTRPGNPITIILLPDTLDVRAWAFVMIEERHLYNLGGTVAPQDLALPLDFDGFSIGMGAGFDLKWTAGPFSLEISAFLLVGMGTKPLLFAGAAGIRGELDLVIISVGVDGLVHFHVSPGYNYIEGHFCGHVDCFFFEISGCVDIRIGDDPPSDIPTPDSPLAGIDLCDHLAAVKGKAARIATDAVPTVWPDTIAVLRCAHYMEDGLGVASDFVRKLPPSAALSPWTGSTELKYAYRLTRVELWQLTGNNPNNAGDWTKVSGPFDAAWWLPTHRKAIIEGGDSPGPSTEEGRELGLFSWDPRAWSRWLGEGTQNVPGDPAQTVDDVCTDNEPAEPACAFGRDRLPITDRFGLFRAQPVPGAAFPSRFNATAGLPAPLDVATLVELGADAGWNWLPGMVAPLHGDIVYHGVGLDKGWRFPSWRQRGQIVATAPLEFKLSKPLLEGELVLEICQERRSAPGKEDGTCDQPPSDDGTFNGFTGQSGTKYEGAMKVFALESERVLELTQGFMTGAYPGVTTAVAVDIDPDGQDAVLIALAADDAVLAQVRTQGPGRQWLTANVAGIARLVIEARGSCLLFAVCWGENSRPAILQLVDLSVRKLPLITAVDTDGKIYELTGDLLLSTVPPNGEPTGQCAKLRYPLPRGPVWTRIDVAPWMLGNVALVALCGVTLEAAIAQQADDNFRDAFSDLLREMVDAAVDNQPTHRVYLDADRMYEIRVGWQWQGWRPAASGDDPPPPAPGGWTNGPGTERFRFHTADFGLATVPAPVEGTSLDVDPAQGGPGYDERSFDPRGISRYLTTAQPTHESPPHFLDDAVGFWFMVDHLQPLVEKYDRTLQVKVLHTRPAAGSLHAAPPHIAGTVHMLDVTVAVNWQVDTLTWFPADWRLVEAAKAAPCIGGAPALGSASVSVNADLDPLTEYDLLLNVAPNTVGATDEVVVARSHFRTSRYQNPTGLLRGLGFESPMGLLPPNDAITHAALAAGALALGDTALDAALTTLGLDPWPLPAGPRTTLIWLRPASAGQSWRVAGILLESDEPVWRAGFTTGAYGEAPAPPRVEVQSLQLFRTYERTKRVFNFPGGSRFITVTVRESLGALTERVRNAAGTRSIFVPASPIVMGTGRQYDIELRLRENGVAGASGKSPMFDRPLIVAQEGG